MSTTRPGTRVDASTKAVGRSAAWAAAATSMAAPVERMERSEIRGQPRRQSRLPTRIALRSMRATAATILPADTRDVGAAGDELVLEALEPAIEMVDAVDHGLALGGERRDHERHRGAQVGRHHGRAAQPGDAIDGRGLAVEMDLCAESHQLLHVHEAVLEDCLGDARGA